MAVYRNAKTESPITSVEFSPVSDGNFTFVSVDSPISVKGVKEWLASKDVEQQVIAETTVAGHPVLVTHGDTTPKELLSKLAERGDDMKPWQRKKAFSEKVWQTGASMAIVGQAMQLTSSFLRPNRQADWNLRMLAVPNLIASAWIFAYGAQRAKDPHRLHYLKTHFNEELSTHAPGGMQAMPDVNDVRLKLHEEQENRPKGLKERVNGFLERNSVTWGEIGLRYLGATSLAFSFNKLKPGVKALAQGEFKEAYNIAKNPKQVTHYAGLLSLAGKTVAITSTAEDPYNPKPPSELDKIREKYTFRTGGWMETFAFGALAVDGFKNKKISFQPAFKEVVKDGEKAFERIKGVKIHRDYISAIGGALFTIRYAMRHWAPFGVRDMNMPELYAHVTDGLAQMPAEKLPQLLADTAADITDHFKDKHLKYGEVFTQLLTDLYRYHHIALDNLGTEPDERAQKHLSQTHSNDTAENEKHSNSVKAKQTLKTPKVARREKPELLGASYAEKVTSENANEIGASR